MKALSVFIEIQAAYFILRTWKQDPAATKRETGIWAHWKEQREENNRPLSQGEVEKMKALLRDHAPSSFAALFPAGEMGRTN